jgi:hypothetical protein
MMALPPMNLVDHVNLLFAGSISRQRLHEYVLAARPEGWTACSLKTGGQLEIGADFDVPWQVYPQLYKGPRYKRRSLKSSTDPRIAMALRPYPIKFGSILRRASTHIPHANVLRIPRASRFSLAAISFQRLCGDIKNESTSVATTGRIFV